MVALSLDSLWSSWPWIPFGLALDDSGHGLCSRFGVDSPAGNRAAVALSLDSVWSSWPWILFGLALDDSGNGLCSRFGVDSPAGNRAAVALSFVERTTNRTKEPPAKENPMSKQ